MKKNLTDRGFELTSSDSLTAVKPLAYVLYTNDALQHTKFARHTQLQEEENSNY